jgi:hypothetical protein
LDVPVDFYEELFSLICTLTARQIDDNMWSLLGLLYDIFQNDAADYFTGNFFSIFQTNNLNSDVQGRSSSQISGKKIAKKGSTFGQKII